MSPEQIIDAIDGGKPDEAAQAMLEQLKARAFWERDRAGALRRQSTEALEKAQLHEDAADGFDVLIDGLEPLVPLTKGAGK